MAHSDARDLNLKVDTQSLKALYQTRPLRHAAGILFNWLIIAATITLSVQFPHPLLYVLAVLVIGARMHALAILMHDASHFRFLKNRKMNDLLTNLFSMYALFSSIEQYRDNHLRHHRNLNTEDDPDWLVKLGRKEFTFPKTKKEFLLTILAYLTLISGVRDALWFLKRFGINKPEKPQNFLEKMPRILFFLTLITVLTLLGGWKIFLLYWIVPYFSTFFMFQYIRSVAEHFGEMEYDHLLGSTRTLRVNALERFFLSPHNVGYHLEHHLYPGVPFYHLPQLHQLLMEQEVYQQKAHVTIGFWSGLMNELGDAEARMEEVNISPAP